MEFLTKAREAMNRYADPAHLRQHEDKVLFFLTLLIGAVVGAVIVAFILLTENLGSRMYPAGGAAWRRVLIPVGGSLITGYLLMRYFPAARGSGIPQTKVALFLHSGFISLRTVVGKFVNSSVSLASGIALGREGPSVQVGAGIASVLGRQFGLSPEKTRSLVPIGASAALAAAFNTPIAAVLFTLEEVLGDLHARVLGAIVLSSATSWMVLHLLLGDEPLFHVPAYQLVHPVEFVLYAALGAVGGLVSVLFVRLLLRLRAYFLRMPSRTAWLQPVAGGLTVGILGWFVPAVLGVGYSHVGDALNSRLALGTMGLLVALKLIATATCYASGNAGGIFGPSLFIGAMLGGAFGAGAHSLLPDYTGSVGAYALVGMGVAFAGIVRVPMTSVIMIFEITRDYSIIVPLMIANLTSYFISSRLQKKPIYQALMHQDGIEVPTPPRDREAPAPASPDAGASEDSPASPDRQGGGVRTATVGGVVAVLVLMVSLAVFLSYHYRSRRVERAENFAQTGKALMAEDRYQEAVERFRSALSISHSSADRLSLATALVSAGRWNEANIYLKELAREMPDSGPVNLGLGRVAVHRQDFKEATHYYHRAIYGTWPDESPADAIAIREELAGSLSGAGRRTQARSELLAMVAEIPDDPAAGKRAAQLLLDYGLYAESVRLFREAIKTNPQDAAVHAGLARAAFALGNFGDARQAFRTALRRDPSDAASRAQLELTDRILALDPGLKGLKASERYERSRELLQSVLDSLDSCLAAGARTSPEPVARTAEEARRTLARKRLPRSLADATESSLGLAGKLWDARAGLCGAPGDSEKALEILMPRLFP